MTEIEQLRKRIRELEAQLNREHTLIACTNCQRGVRPAHAVLGLCRECACAEIENLRRLHES